MLILENKEVFNGLSRAQIEARGGYNQLIQAQETLQPKQHKKSPGFSLQDRAKYPQAWRLHD